MAKIYRQQRHSRDEDDSGSDDEDAGLLWLFRKEAGKAWKSEEGEVNDGWGEL